MGGLLLLIALCIVMATASFLAGALPLSMTLSQSQLRLISSVGIGILVGTSLIVIIPEGIESAATPAEASHLHKARSLFRRSPWTFGAEPRDITKSFPVIRTAQNKRDAWNEDGNAILPRIEVSETRVISRDDAEDPTEGSPKDTIGEGKKGESAEHGQEEKHIEHVNIPAFEIGFSMILGFVLMFLIDRLPRHATESLRSAPETRHMSLDNLNGDTSSVDEEADGFLGSLTPSPRMARSLATTVGLVIHAAADGIAMGASATTSNMRLGLVIFMAIMIHKAPAAFGLTSVLLKQGLSKRAARGHLIIFSLAAPVGALTTWFLITLLGGDHIDGDDGWWTGMLLLFSGGTFLYVAMHAMQEDNASPSHDHSSGMNGFSDTNSPQQRKAKGPQMRDTLATVVGMLLPLLTQFGHHH